MINEPLKDAVEKISAKTPVGSLLRTADWERVPLALRERAQFSAGVESVRVLQTIQDRIQGQIQQQREQLGGGKEATFDRSSFIDALREIAIDEGLTPADPDKRGTIEDITSVPRLGLIYDTQIAQAQGYARWKLDQSEGALLLWPAQEFTRVEDRAEPRTDWPKRFAEAAQAVGDDGALRVQRETGRMIGLKNSPLWAALSRFGTPWPPFDFGSGMGFEDIDREEAVALGLLGEKEIIEGAEKDFNDGLQASAKGLSPELLDKLKEQFGKQIRVEGDSIWWRGDRKGKALVKPKPAPEPEPEPLPAVPAAKFPDSLANLETVRGLGGSTGATLVRDPKTGRQFVLKRGNSPAHIREEFAADQIYRALGVAVPDARLFEEGGNPAKLAEFVPGQTLAQFLKSADAGQKAATLAKLQEHFAADALLGNWDVAGLSLDNILVDESGKPWRIDNGGSLRFRAQGTEKTAAEWNEFPTELWTLRDTATNAQTAQAFGGLTIYDIARQIDSLKPEALDAAPAEVKATLVARLEQLRSLGRKALEYEGSAFVAPHADRVTREILRLREAGLSQQFTPALKMANPNVSKGQSVIFVDPQGRAFDHLRAAKGGSGEAPDKTTQTFNTIVAAAKTVNGHHAKSDTSYNAAKLEAAAKLKPELETLAAKGSAQEKKMAAHYLGALDAIDKAKGNLAAKVPMVTPFKMKAAKASKDQTLIERLSDHMDANGGDWKVIQEWAASQAGSSKSGRSQALKRWLFERLNAKEDEFWDLPGRAPLDEERGKWGAKYERSFEIFHGFVQEMLANIDFSGNDRKARTMRIIRTESTSTAVPFKKGQWGVYRRGVNESGSVATPFSSGPRTVTIVPHVRITSSYFMERNPGKGGDLLLGDDENEFTYMAHGLKALNLGQDADIKADAGSDQSQWPNP